MMPGQKEVFIYRANTGGVNLRSNEANINSSMQGTEFSFLKNVDTYKEGGLSSQLGNRQLNTGVTDETQILGIGKYSRNDTDYVIYQKASGKAYEMAATGGAETEIKTGLNASAVPNYVEFNSKVIQFNGADQPFSWNGTTATDLTGTPAAWVTTKPDAAAVYRGGRIFTEAGNTVYYCALGNELDWTAANDAGSLTGLFNDNSSILALADYDSAIAIFTGRPKIYLLQGTSPSTYATTSIASNRSAKGKLAHCKSNDNLFFFAGDAILPLITTELDIIKLGKDTDIAFKISPFLSAFETDLPLRSIDTTQLDDTIMLSDTLRNQVIVYFKTNGGTYYDTAGIFNFNTLSWTFRMATPVTAAAMVGTKVITGTADGKILEEFSGFGIVGDTSFGKRILSPWFDFGAPQVEKEIPRMWIRCKSTTSVTLTLNFQINYDPTTVLTRTITLENDGTSCAYGSGAYGEDTYATVGVIEDDFPLNLPFDTLRFDLTCDDESVDFRIIWYGFEVDYATAY